MRVLGDIVHLRSDRLVIPLYTDDGVVEEGLQRSRVRFWINGMAYIVFSQVQNMEAVRRLCQLITKADFQAKKDH